MMAITFPQATTKKPRRIRMCLCPACNKENRVQRKAKDDEIGLTVCVQCHLVLSNDEVQSWLIDLD